MTQVKNFVFIVLIFFLLIIALATVSAQSYNTTVRALNQSRIDLQELIEDGYSVLRINDTLSQAEQLFDAQSALMKADGMPDFSLILDKTAEITELREQAEGMGDELKALQGRLDKIDYESEVFAIFDKAKEEFADERYSKVADLVEEAYVKISEEQAVQTRFRAIYEASTYNITNFFRKWWKEIVFTIILITAAYLFLRKRVAIFLVDRKMNNLYFEKEVLGKLIKKSQYEYFHLLKIPEELYHIRIEKFGELIRDIDRQVPVLMEEKERIKGTVKKEEIESNKVKTLHKRLAIIGVLLIVLIATGILLSIYFKLISYAQISGFLRKFGLITESISIITLAITIFIILAVTSALLIVVYIFKEKRGKKPEIKKEGEEIEEGGKGLQSFKLFLLNKIHQMKLPLKNLIESIKRWIEYKQLLKQKKMEDMPRLRYLRKQKIILFKRNLKQKIRAVFHAMRFRKAEEISSEERRKEFERAWQVETEEKGTEEKKEFKIKIIESIIRKWKEVKEKRKEKRLEKKRIAEEKREFEDLERKNKEGLKEEGKNQKESENEKRISESLDLSKTWQGKNESEGGKTNPGKVMARKIKNKKGDLKKIIKLRLNKVKKNRIKPGR